MEVLRLPDGTPPREACLQVSGPLLAALRRAVRAFEPDYLFCPPLPADPLAGVHNDHVTVADAVRRVAYMLNVPHAFTPEYPAADETASEPKKVPVVLTVYDGYMAGAGGGFDLAVDVEASFDRVAGMAWCYQSQVAEWLPWVGRHGMDVPRSFDDWKRALRARSDRRNRELGIPSARAAAVFAVTAWGDVPAYDRLMRDVPNVVPDWSHLDGLRRRLERWRPASGAWGASRRARQPRQPGPT